MFESLPLTLNKKIFNNNIGLINFDSLNNYDILNLDGYDLISNIPYSYNTKILKYDKNIYFKKLDKYLNHNLKYLKNAILLMPNTPVNFSNYSKFKSDILLDFNHSGRKLAFFKFHNSLKSTDVIPINLETNNLEYSLKDLKPKKIKKNININSKKAKEYYEKQAKDRRNIFLSKKKEEYVKNREVRQLKFEKEKQKRNLEMLNMLKNIENN